MGGDQAELNESFTYNAIYNKVEVYTPEKGSAYAEVRVYDAFGNMIGILYPVVATGTLGGQAQNAWEAFQYNQYGQVEKHLWSGGRVDEFTYYPSGSNVEGYLESTVLASGALDLVSAYEYDSVGNIIAEVDANGNRTEYTVNSLNQIVRVTAPSPLLYTTDRWYDSCDELTRIAIKNIDEYGSQEVNAETYIEFEYDERGNCLVTREEVGEGAAGVDWVVRRCFYDAMSNRVEEQFGECANGNQIENRKLAVFDERNLLYTSTSAPAHADESVTRYDYNVDGHLSMITAGIGSSVERSSVYLYDGYGRRTWSRNPEGNVSQHEYDAHGNVVMSEYFGELVETVAGSSVANVLLRKSHKTYDARDRLICLGREWFDPSTGLAIDDGSIDVRYYYTEDSLREALEDDEGNLSTRSYDAAHRLASVTDALGNSLKLYYEDNSNVRFRHAIEVDHLGGAPLVTITEEQYDALNRVTRKIDGDQLATQIAYDSRNSVRETVDRGGNIQKITYDGLGRKVLAARELRVGGTGAGASVGVSQTMWTWDDSSRLTAVTDANGNITEYEYDGRGNVTRINYADGTHEAAEYDVHGNVRQRVDALGTTVTCVHDGLDRLLSRSVTQAPSSVVGSTYEVWRYDGAGSVVYGENDGSVVTRGYDSRGVSLGESLSVNGAALFISAVGSDAAGNTLRLDYPSGRTIIRTLDELGRTEAVSDGVGVIASYAYDGTALVARVDYGNGMIRLHQYDSNRRPSSIAHHHTVGGQSTELLRLDYDWDSVSNLTARENATTGYDWSYSHDSLDRLSMAAVTGGDTMEYEYDGTNNRLFAVRAGSQFSYVRDSAQPYPADFQVNQYSMAPTDPQFSSGIDPMVHDAAGNLTRIDLPSGQFGAPKKRMKYDFANRLVELTDRWGKVTVYTYDVFGRRLESRVDVLGNTKTVRFVYNDAQVIEERSDTGAVLATYVWGREVDEVVTMDRAGATYYYLQDHINSVVGVVDASGGVIERYDYGDFGRPLDGVTLQPLAGSSVGNPYFFAGCRRDKESKWYYMRNRHYMPGKGRFLSPDPMGAWYDQTALGVRTGYVGSNPWTFTDPFGLEKILKIFVDQPTPGSRETWSGFGNPGHAWVTLVDTDHPQDAFSLGFYPSTDGINCSPWHPTKKGVMQNEAEPDHVPDVMAEFELTDEEFQAAAEEMLSWYSGQLVYNLNSQNCCDFVIDVAKAGGVDIPDTTGEWPGGSGSNPADLGEDLVEKKGGVRLSAHDDEKDEESGGGGGKFGKAAIHVDGTSGGVGTAPINYN